MESILLTFIECWASSSSTVYGGKIPESFCAMTCSSNVGQICGNGNVLSLYKASKVSSSAQPVGKSINGQSWQYMSCWGEPQYGRALDTPIDINDNPTVDSCLAAGAARGLKYCGLEYVTSVEPDLLRADYKSQIRPGMLLFQQQALGRKDSRVILRYEVCRFVMSEIDSFPHGAELTSIHR